MSGRGWDAGVGKGHAQSHKEDVAVLESGQKASVQQPFCFASRYVLPQHTHGVVTAPRTRGLAYVAE